MAELSNKVRYYAASHFPRSGQDPGRGPLTATNRHVAESRAALPDMAFHPAVQTPQKTAPLRDRNADHLATSARPAAPPKDLGRTAGTRQLRNTCSPIV